MNRWRAQCHLNRTKPRDDCLDCCDHGCWTYKGIKLCFRSTPKPPCECVCVLSQLIANVSSCPHLTYICAFGCDNYKKKRGIREGCGKAVFGLEEAVEGYSHGKAPPKRAAVLEWLVWAARTELRPTYEFDSSAHLCRKWEYRVKSCDVFNVNIFLCFDNVGPLCDRHRLVLRVGDDHEKFYAVIGKQWKK